MTTSNLIQTLILVVCVTLAVWGMRRGWHRRQLAQRVRLGNLHQVPPLQERGKVLLGPVSGIYTGSAFAPNWQERVAWAGIGLRARTTLTSYAEGFLLDIDPPGHPEGLWIPATAVVAVRSERAAAGKVARNEAFGVIRWTLQNGTLLDTGFRAHEPAAQEAWLSSNDHSGRVR